MNNKSFDELIFVNYGPRLNLSLPLIAMQFCAFLHLLGDSQRSPQNIVSRLSGNIIPPFSEHGPMTEARKAKDVARPPEQHSSSSTLKSGALLSQVCLLLLLLLLFPCPSSSSAALSIFCLGLSLSPFVPPSFDPPTDHELSSPKLLLSGHALRRD